MPLISQWIQTQHTLVSLSLKGTKKQHVLKSISHILIIQRDSFTMSRFCVERFSLDAVTGRLK
ncbi:hypothetical protein M9458_000262, partial [Cirrhinus mrigala]